MQGPSPQRSEDRFSKLDPFTARADASQAIRNRQRHRSQRTPSQAFCLAFELTT